MARNNKSEDTRKVAEMLPPRGNVRVGKPGKIITSALRSKMAFPMSGLTTVGSGGNFYSPELSTDFLELPQTVDEQRNYYRFFYEHEPFVAQALDQHTELPLSKIRITVPAGAQNRDLAKKATRWIEKWAKTNHLLRKLISITHEYHLLGESIVFCEDTSPDMPREIWEVPLREVTEKGELKETWQKRDEEDASARALEWLEKHYKGWTAVRTLPPEQVMVESFPFTDKQLIELVPDSKTKAIVQKAQQGDPRAIEIVESMPEDVVEAIIHGRNVPLNTDPQAGSFVFIMARKKCDYESRGKSILQRCLLPGTPIWVNRDGILQQVPVEEVNDQTDLMLTHKGRFRSCTAGSRKVDESITVLDIEGMQEPLRLTSDHEVLRVRENGDDEWVEAGKLTPGDLLLEGHIIPEVEPVTRIDLVDWWNGRSVVTHKRGRCGHAEVSREIRVVEASHAGGLHLVMEYENDNRNRRQASSGLTRLLEWASSLLEPVVMTQAQVAVAAGVTPRDVRVYTPRLRNEGLLQTESRSLGRGRGRQVTWFPADADALPPIRASFTSAVTEIDVTEDFCYLLGTWLGDGCVWTNKEHVLDTHGIGWSLHEETFREKVRGLLESCFPKAELQQGALVTKRGHQGDLWIEDPLLARWFQEEFGKGFEGKHLPEWVFGLSPAHKRGILQGILDADGWVKKSGSCLAISLRNKTLIDQLHLLASSVGWQTQVQQKVIQPCTWKVRWENRFGSQEKAYSYGKRKCWVLSCCRSGDVRDWTAGGVKHPGEQESQQNYTWKSRFQKGRLTRKVRSVKPLNYRGLVYSFGVAEDESHVTNGLVTHNCLRTLVFRDKIRQSLTSISSRHMTPYRLIYAEDMDDEQTEALREQVDLALQDPDYSIITNFQVNWEEMGADQRLPDWSWVWDFTDRQLYAGLGVTESLLSGESSYSGDRINLEVINTRYMLFRELIQEMVEDFIFQPMCERMGFMERGEDGNLVPLVPRISFTRLALRDNSDTFDALFNLYTKGSLDIDVILDLLNIDPEATKEKLERDLFGVNDSTFNEVTRGIATRAGDMLAENSDVVDKIAANLGLRYTKPKEEGVGRF